MDWYFVIKTINGRRYRYRQKTWRENGRVRTRSEYIGPADGPPRSPKHPDLSGATTLTFPFPTQAGSYDRVLIESSLQALLDTSRTVENWERGWDPTRYGKSLVRFHGRVHRMLNALGVVRNNSREGAYYRPRSDLINIPPSTCYIDAKGETATEAYYTTIFHELVHWTMHASRLGRYSDELIRDREKYAREELVAELGAVILLQHFELQTGTLEMHATYFQNWLGRAGTDRNAALLHARHEADRAVQYILERGTIRK
jgi:hypothetical protein